jgi:hypothetical protein
MHCSNLAADALHEAIKDYMSKRESPGKTGKQKKEDYQITETGQ